MTHGDVCVIFGDICVIQGVIQVDICVIQGDICVIQGDVCVMFGDVCAIVCMVATPERGEFDGKVSSCTMSSSCFCFLEKRERNSNIM